MNIYIQKAIDEFDGNQHKLSRAIKVSQPAISKWLLGLNNPSAKHAMRIEKVTNGKVTAQELRPDIFADDF